MFVAVLRRDRRPNDGAELLSALQATHPGRVSGSAVDGRFAAAQTLLLTTPESRHEKVPAADPGTGRLLASWLRLDNRDDLTRDLGWSRSEAEQAADPEIVLAAYERWGTQCVELLEGDFAFALWDPDRGAVFAARDSAGIRPLYYSDTDTVFACATTTACLDAVPGVPLEVRPEWLAQYLHGRSTTWDRTPFAGVAKLPPGHSLWADDHTVRVQRYHRFRDDSPWEDHRDPRWLTAYRERLFAAVAARVRTDDPVGAENSGGLDSATMVGLIPHLRPDAEMHTYGYATQELEPTYIAAAAFAVPLARQTSLTEYPDLADVSSTGWRALGYPVEHPNAVSHLPIYRAAGAADVRTLHSGHGGDEVVTQSARHAITESLGRRRYLGLARDLPGSAWLGPARVARHWWFDRRPPANAMLEALTGRLASTPLTREAFVAADIENLTVTAGQFAAPYRTVNGFILGDRWSPATSTRTADCSVVAATFGIDYVWPLLDRRLMQQYLSTPTIWKYGAGYGRYLHRRAISGLVSDLVAWKPDKNMMGPADVARVEAERARMGPPRRGHDELHPAIRDLIDPAAWRRGPLSTTDLLGGQPYRHAVMLSDWLGSRS